MPTEQDSLFDALNKARFTLSEMDRAYDDGAEDAYDKISELILQSDFTISLEELLSFCEAEKGWEGDPVTFRPDTVGHDVRDPIRFNERIRLLRESEQSYPEAP
jgi:hypothetical protein